MSLEHTPLDGNRLGADAQRALASPQAKMMAARGMAPIANPRDLLALMYQLALDPDEKLRAAAKKSLEELPEDVVRAGLADPASDARVLDFMARKLQTRGALLQVICLNGAVADPTIATIAALADEETVDVVLTNEERLIRYPEIIYSMYMNKNARMSTVDRAVELAVRNNVVVPGLQAWEEICQAVLESQTQEKKDAPALPDAVFKAALEEERPEAEADEPDAEKKNKAWRDMSIPEKIRAATLGTDYMRGLAVKDAKVIVALAALKSPMVKEKDVVKWAGLQALDKRIVGYIATNRQWAKSYSIKVALVNNAKCPLREAVSFISSLREKDLKNLAKSKNVPGPVSTAARRLMSERKPGNG